MKLDLVENKEDIKNNMTTLDSSIRSSVSEEKYKALDLLRKGRCFIADRGSGDFRFYPSRFVGYTNNTIALHEHNDEKDGRQTNRIISRLLHSYNEGNNFLDNEYLKYCRKIGIIPAKNKRTYWLWDEDIIDRSNDNKNHYGISNREQFENAEIIREIEKEIYNLDVDGREKEAIVKIRVNQSEFRKRILMKYGKCCLCGVSNHHFLVASHIKPWSASEADEKLNIDNGLLLCPNHDQLFDQGFISFSEEGKIMISNDLDSGDKIFMNITDDMRIDLSLGNRNFMKYHRDNIFRK